MVENSELAIATVILPMSWIQNAQIWFLETEAYSRI